MPRKPRIEYAGAVYHVMCRGDRRESVFRDDRDHESFIETLGEACGRCGWVVHAYVLMANHHSYT
ncbi:MAG: transposase [Lentisphaerae bacterium]|nr:transposase [Lentisphaerota bacterium]